MLFVDEKMAALFMTVLSSRVSIYTLHSYQINNSAINKTEIEKKHKSA